MQLYADPRTINCRKVFAGFDLIQIEYEFVHVDFVAQAHKTPRFLAINPNGELPALVDGALTLSESNAILQYGAEIAEAHEYYPREAQARADIHRWHLWEAAKWYTSCYVYLVENVLKPLCNQEPDLALVESAAPNWHRLADIADKRLSERRWLCGDSVTIADIAIAAPIHLHRWQRLPLDSHPNLQRWMIERVEQLPCWKNSDPVPMLGLTVGMANR
jgi:glutathione S-transferase